MTFFYLTIVRFAKVITFMFFISPVEVSLGSVFFLKKGVYYILCICKDFTDQTSKHLEY